MGLFDSLVAKYQQIKQKHENKDWYKKELLNAVADGRLSAEEIQQLDRFQQTLGLSNDDVSRIRLAAFEMAYRSIKQDGVVSGEEERELVKIQAYLAIPDSAIVKTKAELSRLRLVSEIQVGNLPQIDAGTLVLQKGEVAHWSEPAQLIEERVVGRRYVGSSTGVSFRVARGVSFRVGASRGQLVTDKANVAVSFGDLVVTSKRIVFRGNKKSFNYRLDKVLDAQMYSDGMLLTDTAGKARAVQFNSKTNSDIVGSVFTQALNKFLSD